MSNKIFTVCGTRPQLIKIDKELPNQVLIFTGQHYSPKMSDDFFKELKLPKPDINLHCKSNQTGRMIDKLYQLFLKENPKLVIVHGDTNSALAGAIAAVRAKVKLVHIEAGARIRDLSLPEEMNRVLIDTIATLRIALTREHYKNLKKEHHQYGKDEYVRGDPMFDAMAPFMPLKKTKDSMKYNLLTIHRDFNADNVKRLDDILWAIGRTEKKCYFPVHPRTKKLLRKFKIPQNIKVMEPVRYKQMLTLESNANKVITDSGGVQREAYWMGIPCVVLRDKTEWNHTVQDGLAVLVGDDAGMIQDILLNWKPVIRHSEFPKFGANKRIREIIANYV